MSFKNLLGVLLVVGVLVGTAYAAAASLGVGGGVIQSGQDDDLTCDGNGVTVEGWGYEGDTNLVSYVRIGGIDASCEGLSLGIRVLDNGGGWLTSGWHETLTSGECEPGNAKVDFDADQQPQNIGSIRVTIEGAE